MKNSLCLMAFVTLCGGCAAPYTAPTNVDTATVTFTAPAAQMSGLAQTVFVVSGPECANPSKIAGFSNLSDERVAQQAVAAGKRQFLRSTLGDSRVYSLLRTCSNLVSFTPAKGAKYEFKQRFAGNACLVDVVDVATKAAPSDLQKHDAKPCG